MFGPADVRERVARRAALVATMSSILNKAEKEGRSLTSEEIHDFDNVECKIKAIDAELDANRSTAPLAVQFPALHRMPGEGLAPPPLDGEVRALTNQERIADVVRSEGDGEPLSLMRAIRGMVLGDWDGAKNEKRAMGEGTGGLGGWLVPAAVSGLVIDLARNQSACIRAGARTIPMETPELTVVKVTTDPVAHWRAEHAAISESDMGFVPLKLKAQALGCLCRVSLELLEDAKAFSQTVEGAMSQAIALEMDRVGLLGTGVGEPRGLFHTDGVQVISMGANGAALADHGPFSQAVEAVANYNGTANAAVYSPRTAGQLDRLQDTLNQPLQPPESFRNLAKFATNQVPTNQVHGTALTASCAFVGDFTQLVFGVRTQIVMEASRVAGSDTFAKMQALIRAYIRADVAVLRPNHFDIIKGIL